MNRFTRTILFGLLMIIGLTASAQTFKHDGIWYNVIGTEEVAVAKPGNNEFYEGSVEIPLSIDYQGRTYSVTKIAAAAFAESDNLDSGIHKLTSVTMADNITSIEEGAFQNCVNLQSAKISNRTTYVGVNAFADCRNMTSLTLSRYLEEIRDGAFLNCEKVGQVALYDRLKKIGNQAFAGCKSLSSIDIPNSTISVGNSAFSNCSALSNVKFGTGVEKIGESAFENCTGLKSIVLPSQLATIDVATFQGCSILSSITFGSAVQTISDKAFYGCKGIMSLTIPSSVTEIGESAFGGCDGINTLTFADSSERLRYGSGNFTTSPIERLTLGRTLQYTSNNSGAFSELSREVCSLKRVEITSTVVSLPEAIFRGCKALSNVTVASGLQEVGRRAFESCEALTSLQLPSTVERILSDAFAKCYYLADFTLPSKVTVIESGSFSYCRRLTSVDLSNVTEIKASGFQECDQLADVKMSANLKVIGQNAFATCINLRSITIPENVQSIGRGAFFGTERLDEVTSLAINPPTAASDTWEDTTYKTATLNVPSSSILKYKKAEGWKNFTSLGDFTTYSVTVSSNAGGSVLLNGEAVSEIELLENESLKIEVTPNAGNIIKSASYTTGGVTKTFTGSVTISPVTADVTVNVTFAEKQIYTVNVNSNAGGSVKLNGEAVNEVKIFENESVKIEAIPNMGKIIESASYTMGGVTKAFAGSVTIDAVTADVTVDVTFADKPIVPPTSIAFARETYRIKPGESVGPVVNFYPEDTYSPVTFSIVSGDGVIQLNGDLITGISNGSATVKATTDSGLTATCTVVVNDGAIEIEAFDFLELNRFEPHRATLSGADDVDSASIKWSTSNESYARFFDGNVFMIVNEGDTDEFVELTISAELPDGRVVSEMYGGWGKCVNYSLEYMGATYVANAPFSVTYYSSDVDLTSDIDVPESFSLDGFDYSVNSVYIHTYSGDKDVALTLPASITDIDIQSNFINSITSMATVPPVGSLSLWTDPVAPTVLVPAESVNAYKASGTWNKYVIKAIGSSEKEYTVTVSSNEGGAVYLNGKVTTSMTVKEGESLSIYIESEAGRIVEHAEYSMAGSAPVRLTDRTQTDIVVTGDVEIRVTYAAEQRNHEVAVNANAGGAVYLNGNLYASPIVVPDGSSLDISVEPEAGKMVKSAYYQMGAASYDFTDECKSDGGTVIDTVTDDVTINVVFADDDNNVDPGYITETVTFDFTSPGILNPAQSPNTSNSPVCEVANVRFTDGKISLVMSGGSTSARLWYYQKKFQCRLYDGGEATLSVNDNNTYITGLVINGSQIDALQIWGNVLDTATYYTLTPSAQLTIDCVSNGSHKRADISSITVEYITSSGVESVISDSDDGDITVYTLQGVEVGHSTDGLQPGLYIIKQGKKVSKVVIR